MKRSTTVRVPLLALFLLGLLSLALPAAAQPQNQADARENLRLARQKWSNSADSYSMFFSSRCNNCDSTETKVRVVDNVIVSVTYTTNEQDVRSDTNQRTVLEMFDLIEDALEQNAAVVDVTYDPTFGYPTKTVVDYDPSRPEDDVSVVIRNYFPLTFESRPGLTCNQKLVDLSKQLLPASAIYIVLLKDIQFQSTVVDLLVSQYPGFTVKFEYSSLNMFAAEFSQAELEFLLSDTLVSKYLVGVECDGKLAIADKPQPGPTGETAAAAQQGASLAVVLGATALAALVQA